MRSASACTTADHISWVNLRRFQAMLISGEKAPFFGLLFVHEEERCIWTCRFNTIMNCRPKNLNCSQTHVQKMGKYQIVKTCISIKHLKRNAFRDLNILQIAYEDLWLGLGPKELKLDVRGFLSDLGFGLALIELRPVLLDLRLDFILNSGFPLKTSLAWDLLWKLFRFDLDSSHLN